jgi:hypothetical protein
LIDFLYEIVLFQYRQTGIAQSAKSAQSLEIDTLEKFDETISAFVFCWLAAISDASIRLFVDSAESTLR